MMQKIIIFINHPDDMVDAKWEIDGTEFTISDANDLKGKTIKDFVFTDGLIQLTVE
jgi:hypothetical protein